MAKACSRCRETKPLSEFNKNRSRKDGLHHRCRPCAAQDRKDYSHRHRKRILEGRRQWYLENADSERKRAREFRKKYYATSPEKVFATNSRYRKSREEKDPLFKAAGRLRSLTYDAFRRKGFSKRSRTSKLLGCDFEIARRHIESQFKEGMPWENHGEWHIDHVVPLSSASCLKSLEALCHYTNLQPLWARENILKGGLV